MNEEVINKTENEELKGQLLNLFKEDKIELDPEISDVIDEMFVFNKQTKKLYYYKNGEVLFTINTGSNITFEH